MQITFKKQMTKKEIAQAIFEKLNQLEDSCAFSHSQGATLYINPINDRGEPVILIGEDGQAIKKLVADGPAPCHADALRI